MFSPSLFLVLCLLKWRWWFCVVALNLSLGWWLCMAGEGWGVCVGGWEHMWRGKWRRRLALGRTTSTTTLSVTLSTLMMAVFSSFSPRNWYEMMKISMLRGYFTCVIYMLHAVKWEELEGFLLYLFIILYAFLWKRESEILVLIWSF